MIDTHSQDNIQTLAEIQQWLQTYIGKLLSIDASKVDLAQPLEALALDSLNVVRMAGDLEDYLHIEVESSLIYEYESLNAFCHQLEQMHAGSHERKKGSGHPIRISIAASFTSEPVEESYAHWLKSLGYNPTVEFAGYNQLFQELLNPQSTLSSSQSTIKIVLFRVEDWFRFEADPVAKEKADATLQEFVSALEQFAARSTTKLILGLCPHSSAQVRQLGLSAILNSLDEENLAVAAKTNNVIALDLRSLPETYQIQRIIDEARDQLGHIPFTPAFFSALGTELARWTFNQINAPRKVIVLDCDNTLWQGVVGEDGPLGIKLSSPYLQLQSFMKDQREQGKLLCLASKNNESDVLEVFDLRPDMQLRSEEIIAHRINWKRKSQSLAELATELNLGLDSFIFVDDNPAECQEVASCHPEVLVVQLPQEVGQIPDFLSHHWAFDIQSVTAEDRKRTELYRNNQQREALRAESQNFQDFIKGLEVKTTIQPLNEADIVRAAQLTHRTNQFNATTIRRSENEIRALLDSEDYHVESVKVSDRFGDYGTVGLLVSKCETDTFVAETILMSCRVLGKQVEQTMVTHLSQQADRHDLEMVALRFRASEKNQPIHRFYDSLGVPFETVDGDLKEIRFKTDETTLRIEKSLSEVEEQNQPETKAPPKSSQTTTIPHSPCLQAIAEARGETKTIQEAIRGHATLRRGELKTAFIAPRTAWQKKISAIWCEVLQIDRVGIYDSFFELGGDSLKAAEVFARMWELGAPQSISLVNIPEPTIAVLCQAIEDVKAGRTPTLVTDLTSLEQEGQVPSDIQNEGYDPAHTLPQ